MTDAQAYPPPGTLAYAEMQAAHYGEIPPHVPPAHTPEHLAPGPQPVEIPAGRSMAPIASLPPSDFLMSLTGFDEIAIAARFGQPLHTIREDPIAAGRALAFVHYRRAGQNDVDAHNAALSLTLREVTEFFVPEGDPADAEGNGVGAP
jgi:hypothetical protein